MNIKLTQCGESVCMTLADFFLIADSDAGERRSILDHLELNGEYSDGGGADEEWTITVIGESR